MKKVILGLVMLSGLVFGFELVYTSSNFKCDNNNKVNLGELVRSSKLIVSSHFNNEESKALKVDLKEIETVENHQRLKLRHVEKFAQEICSQK